MDQILVRRIKFSTIGIGVHNYTDNDIIMIGSGFYYDTRGYLISAAHVLKKAQKIDAELKLKNKKSKIMKKETLSFENKMLIPITILLAIIAWLSTGVKLTAAITGFVIDDKLVSVLLVSLLSVIGFMSFGYSMFKTINKKNKSKNPQPSKP